MKFPILLLLAAPLVCQAVSSINWNSTDFSISGDRIVGRSSFASLKSFTSTESTGPLSDFDTVLPLPGPLSTDTQGTKVELPFPGASTDNRQAEFTQSITGDPLGTMTILNAGGAWVRNQNINGQTVSAQSHGSANFTGLFTSQEGELVLDYSGLFNNYIFIQNGATSDSQFGTTEVNLTLEISNDTQDTSLLSTTIHSDTNANGSFGLAGGFGNAFSGQEILDLSGTFGDTILVSVTADFENWSWVTGVADGQQGGALVSGGYDDIDLTFTNTNPIPEPSTVALLFGSAALLLLTFRHRKARGNA